jgi:hypothetical protein
MIAIGILLLAERLLAESYGTLSGAVFQGDPRIRPAG